MSEETRRYRDALEGVLGATRQAATCDRWERACRLSEELVANALGMPSRLANAEHHLSPEFTEDARRQNAEWLREAADAKRCPVDGCDGTIERLVATVTRDCEQLVIPTSHCRCAICGAMFEAHA